MDSPTFIPITRITDETANVKTFYFPAQGGSASGGSHPLKSKPGQFIMLWIPGIDQKPFSIGYDNGEQLGLTIFNRGPLTQELFAMKVGDRVGVSGPYGTSFSVKPNTHYIMVGGGYGAAPHAFLAEAVVPLGSTVDFCVGARTAADILFEKRMRKLAGVTVHIATDDGSAGHKGYVTDLLTVILSKAKDLSKQLLVVTCGPELMEYKVLEICNLRNLACEISIERYMKCGFGICGQCCVDPLGLRMCTEGPVVSREVANQLTEFGKYHRSKSGAKINF